MIARAKTGVVERLAELAKLGRHADGIDRRPATPQERAARDLFAQWALQSGFVLSQDRVGNLFARKHGVRDDLAPILVGSHLDTVPTGGAYDGAYGVAGALCALDLLVHGEVATNHPVEAAAWIGEEGSRFPMGCLGSSVFAGLTGAGDALAMPDDQGISLESALSSRDAGLLPDVAERSENRAAAYLELHVEQGPVLDAARISLGIVTAIAAQRRYRVTVEGESGHAGTVPMDRRSDALCAAAEIILALEAAAGAAGECVATVGRIVAEPNGTNVIPARATFSIDARSAHADRIDAIEGALSRAISQAQTRRRVKIGLQRLEARAATPMNAALRAAVRRAIETMDLRAMDVASGAGHDAMCLACIAPAAMIFVPSIGGHSHVGAERTADSDLELGVRALALSIVEVDKIVP